MGKGMRNATKQLWDVVESDQTELPPALIDALGKALAVGLSADQIAATILLSAGVYEFEAEGPLLDEKVRKTLRVMQGFKEFTRARSSAKPPGAL